MGFTPATKQTTFREDSNLQRLQMAEKLCHFLQ